VSIAVHSTYTLWCDQPLCTMFIRGTTSRAEVRRSAAKRGWQVNVDKVTRTGGKDFCPDHKPAPEATDA
jgi:hypothetical protein